MQIKDKNRKGKESAIFIIIRNVQCILGKSTKYASTGQNRSYSQAAPRTIPAGSFRAEWLPLSGKIRHKKPRHHCQGYFFRRSTANKATFLYFAASTDTNDLSLYPFLKVTVPSTKANNVWSLPNPTFAPG